MNGKNEISIGNEIGQIMQFIFFCRFYMQPWLRRRKAARAEEFANFLYDQRKKRALQQSED